MAGVAIWPALEIVLMLWLRFSKVARWDYLCHDLSRPQPGGIDLRDGFLRDAFLLIVGVEDRRLIARAGVVALSVLGGEIVNLEEELQQLAESELFGIKMTSMASA
jgi:hypothetical protein